MDAAAADAASRGRQSAAKAAKKRREAVALFADRLVNKALDSLLETNCLQLRLPASEEEKESSWNARQGGEDDEGKTKQNDEPAGVLVAQSFREILSEERRKEQEEPESSQEPVLESTALGRISCNYYIAPQTAKLLSDAFEAFAGEGEGGTQKQQETLGFAEIMRLLSSVGEFSEMPVR